MSKKNLLNEVRRFMKLANLDASVSSNFVTKLEEMDTAYLRDEDENTMQEEEEEEEMEMDMEMPDADEEEEGEEEMDMDMDMDMELPDADEAGEADEAVLTDEEADAIIALADKLRAAREEGGEEMDMDMEMDMDEEPLEEAEEETLEEILADVLAEDEEETLEEKETIEEYSDYGYYDRDNPPKPQPKTSNMQIVNRIKDTASKLKAASGNDRIDLNHIQGTVTREEAEKELAALQKMAKGRNLGEAEEKKAARMEEELVQEVLRRVKTRLSKMTKEE